MNLQAQPFRDQDLKRALRRALRTVSLFALVSLPVIWIALGWRSMLLFLVGAVIAATGILEWQQLMGAVLGRLSTGGTPRPVGPVLLWFFLRLGAAALLLYVSLRSLEGSVYALIAGLSLAVVALVIEAVRIMHSWSM